MIIKWDRDKGQAVVTDIAGFSAATFPITSDVRNELNGRRVLHKKSEVVNCINAFGQQGQPYMPRPFPKGAWRITGVEPSSEAVYFPVKIRTDACQTVDLWSLDKDGGYDKKTGISALDYGYLLHFSNSSTTLGCGRIGDFNSAVILAATIMLALGRKETVTLEVV